MEIETLVSSMNCNSPMFTAGMNICTDVVVIDQNGRTDKNIELFVCGKRIRYFSSDETGLSKSRNKAVEKSVADVCVITDKGFVFADGAGVAVYEAYQRFSDDVLVFKMIREGRHKKRYPSQSKKIGRLSLMKVSSCEISFRRESIVNAGIKFNESFGSGARYPGGEEAIFLKECLDKGLSIRFVPILLGEKPDTGESTWFKGYNADFFKAKGAMFRALYGRFAPLMMLQFAVRKYKLYKDTTDVVSAVKYMMVTEK